MTTHDQRMMLLDIDGILTHHHATPTDVLTAAQALAVSAIGDLVNKSLPPLSPPIVGEGLGVGLVSTQTASSAASIHRAADAIAEQIREALHKRIDEGKLPEW